MQHGDLQSGYTASTDYFVAKIDEGPPITTDGVDSSWHNGPVTVTLTCTDTNGSGCASTYYTTDGSIPTTSSSQGNSFTLSNDGIYTIKYFSVDKVGNVEPVKTATNTVKIDKTKPLGSFLINGGATSTTSSYVTVNLFALDNMSGVYQMKLSESLDQTNVPWQSYVTSKQFTLSGGDGKKTLYVRFRDNALNESYTYAQSIVLENSGSEVVSTPSVTLTPSPTSGVTYTPVPSTSPAPTTTTKQIQVQDQSGKPVVNTEIFLDGVKYITDGSGRITVKNLSSGDHKISGKVGDSQYTQTFILGTQKELVITFTKQGDNGIYYICGGAMLFILLVGVGLYLQRKDKDGHE